MKIEVLDHGFVELVESWGSDERVIEAARTSTQKGFLGWDAEHSTTCVAYRRNELDMAAFEGGCTCPGGKPVRSGDARLLRYLWKRKHTTPFEMSGMTMIVQAPIFVFRQWHRHRVPWSYNEASARYAPLPAEDYLPTVNRLMSGNNVNKQTGSLKGSDALTSQFASQWRDALSLKYAELQALYEEGLAGGIPQELARGALTVFRYSKMMASANLHGWLHFLSKRLPEDAQWETRQFAEAAHRIATKCFPRTLRLFAEGRGKD